MSIKSYNQIVYRDIFDYVVIYTNNNDINEKIKVFAIELISF